MKILVIIRGGQVWGGGIGMTDFSELLYIVSNLNYVNASGIQKEYKF